MPRGTDICVNCVYAENCGKRRASDVFIRHCDDYITPQEAEDIWRNTTDTILEQISKGADSVNERMKRDRSNYDR